MLRWIDELNDIVDADAKAKREAGKYKKILDSRYMRALVQSIYNVPLVITVDNASEISTNLGEIDPRGTSQLFSIGCGGSLTGKHFDFKAAYKKGVVKDVKERNDLPENFNWQEQMPQCASLFDIRDQGSCSSCWAFATAEVMSDRICIKSKGKYQIIFIILQSLKANTSTFLDNISL